VLAATGTDVTGAEVDDAAGARSVEQAATATTSPQATASRLAAPQLAAPRLAAPRLAARLLGTWGLAAPSEGLISPSCLRITGSQQFGEPGRLAAVERRGCQPSSGPG
jgi:hypothetical protein